MTALVFAEVHDAGEELSRAGGDLPPVEAGADIDEAVLDSGELAEKHCKRQGVQKVCTNILYTKDKLLQHPWQLTEVPTTIRIKLT